MFQLCQGKFIKVEDISGEEDKYTNDCTTIYPVEILMGRDGIPGPWTPVMDLLTGKYKIRSKHYSANVVQ